MVLHATNAKLERLRRDGGVVVNNVEGHLHKAQFEPEASTNQHEELEFEEMFQQDDEPEMVQTPRVSNRLPIIVIMHLVFLQKAGHVAVICSMIQAAGIMEGCFDVQSWLTEPDKRWGL